MPGLTPPKTLDDFGDANSLGASTAKDRGVEFYVREYRAGWTASGRSGDSAKYNSGSYSWAWEDGYLDRAADRERWHLPHCKDHANTPAGCQEA